MGYRNYTFFEFSQAAVICDLCDKVLIVRLACHPKSRISGVAMVTYSPNDVERCQSRLAHIQRRQRRCRQDRLRRRTVVGRTITGAGTGSTAFT